MTDLFSLLDNAYSNIGEAMSCTDDVPEEARAEALAKAKELDRLAEELAALLRGAK